MEKHLLVLLILSIMLSLTIAAFAALRENRLDVYISVFTIEYLALTEIFRPRRKFISFSGLDFLSLGLFIIFGFIVARKVIEILVR